MVARGLATYTGLAKLKRQTNVMLRQKCALHFGNKLVTCLIQPSPLLFNVTAGMSEYNIYTVNGGLVRVFVCLAKWLT